MEFVQERITTLHAVGEDPPSVSLDRVAVVIPVMGTDLSPERGHDLCGALADAAPGHVVLSVRGAREQAGALAREAASQDLDATVLRCDDPGLVELLDAHGIDAPAGKGLDVWLGMAVAAAEHEIVVVQDADVRPYEASDVSRLAWPIANGFDFAKGYYARIERDRMFGRLVRLLWFPLLSVLESERSAPVLEYLAAFRYPLAGEFAMRASDVAALRPYPRWGLETGMLFEMFETAGAAGSAQVDLGVHQHDHRPVEGEHGLASMAEEVVGTLVAELDRRGVSVSPASMGAAYARRARSFVDRYAADAAYNDLRYDRADEEGQIETYRSVLEGRGTVPGRLPAFEDVDVDAADVRDAGVVHGARPGTRSVR